MARSLPRLRLRPRRHRRSGWIGRGGSRRPGFYSRRPYTYPGTDATELAYGLFDRPNLTGIVGARWQPGQYTLPTGGSVTTDRVVVFSGTNLMLLDLWNSPIKAMQSQGYISYGKSAGRTLFEFQAPIINKGEDFIEVAIPVGQPFSIRNLISIPYYSNYYRSTRWLERTPGQLGCGRICSPFGG